MSDRPNVVFVSSLAHSGSTLLGLLVNERLGGVGVGELNVFLRGWQADRDAIVQRPCTCGVPSGECPLWSRALAFADAGGARSDADVYAAVQQAVVELAGPGAVMVDISKRPVHLRAAARLAPTTLVLRLTRDVRSWTASEQRRVRARGTGRGGVLRATAPAVALRWYRHNRALDDAAGEIGTAVLPVGYERLVFDTSEVLDAVEAWVWSRLGGPDPVAGGARNHLIGGNRMRYAYLETGQLRYDAGWMRGGPLLSLAAAVAPLHAYNRRMVHDT
ncbi:MAG: hypothetical protein MUF83_02630 [Acidimicrobiales bacterium]|jgi:hypothetical protein|nr:hypothetical protein [Acidimicrobiales bacterium]